MRSRVAKTPATCGRSSRPRPFPAPPAKRQRHHIHGRLRCAAGASVGGKAIQIFLETASPFAVVISFPVTWRGKTRYGAGIGNPFERRAWGRARSSMREGSRAAARKSSPAEECLRLPQDRRFEHVKKPRNNEFLDEHAAIREGVKHFKRTSGCARRSIPRLRALRPLSERHNASEGDAGCAHHSISARRRAQSYAGGTPCGYQRDAAGRNPWLRPIPEHATCIPLRQSEKKV